MNRSIFIKFIKRWTPPPHLSSSVNPPPDQTLTMHLRHPLTHWYRYCWLHTVYLWEGGCRLGECPLRVGVHPNSINYSTLAYGLLPSNSPCLPLLPLKESATSSAVSPFHPFPSCWLVSPLFIFLESIRILLGELFLSFQYIIFHPSFNPVIYSLTLIPPEYHFHFLLSLDYPSSAQTHAHSIIIIFCIYNHLFIIMSAQVCLYSFLTLLS